MALIRDTRTVQTASGAVQRQSHWIDDSRLSFLSHHDNGRDILQMLFQAIGTKHFLRYLDFLYMSAALLTNSGTQIDRNINEGSKDRVRSVVLAYNSSKTELRLWKNKNVGSTRVKRYVDFCLFNITRKFSPFGRVLSTGISRQAPSIYNESQ